MYKNVSIYTLKWKPLKTTQIQTNKAEINMKFNYIQCKHKSLVAGKVKPPIDRLAQKPWHLMMWPRVLLGQKGIIYFIWGPNIFLAHNVPNWEMMTSRNYCETCELSSTHGDWGMFIKLCKLCKTISFISLC